MEIGVNMRLDLATEKLAKDLLENFGYVFEGHSQPEDSEFWTINYKRETTSLSLHWQGRYDWDDELGELFKTFANTSDIKGAYVLICGDDWFEIWVYHNGNVEKHHSWQDEEIGVFLYGEDYALVDKRGYDEDKAILKFIDEIREHYLSADRA